MSIRWGSLGPRDRYQEACRYGAASVRVVLSRASASPPVDARRPLGPSSRADGFPHSAVRARYIYRRLSSRGGLQDRFPLPGPHLFYESRARLLHLRSESVRAVLGHASAPPPVDARRPLDPSLRAVGFPGVLPRYRVPAIPGAPGACRVPPEGSRWLCKRRLPF
ncbi:hypothetical protein NDU88_003809 [Pleurodeles waltl]|uniref:Uncharacterized protein n=1 Tax=Pleurodeles waltl TaxID=8319 RepID=A0AAV7MZN1_PLEWA|nr:hypothetical protein NDU88_003809 [Pleurodeles waltl]